MSDPELPPPPRPVSWRLALAKAWPLALMASALIVSGLGMLILLKLVGVGDPMEDLALNRRALVTSGEVTGSSKTGAGLWLVRFQFTTPRGDRIESQCYTERDIRAGQPVSIDYLPVEPIVSRITGSRRTIRGLWQNVPLGVAMGGLLLVLIWLRGALRHKLLLTHGEAAVATIDKVAGAGRLQVSFAFTTRSGEELSGHQIVPGPSVLGMKITAGERSANAIYDPTRPQRHVLIDASAFE